jgi:hypothetical protein
MKYLIEFKEYTVPTMSGCAKQATATTNETQLNFGSLAAITAALTNGFTITACATNCSSKGSCVLSSWDSTVYMCSCFQDYTG